MYAISTAIFVSVLALVSSLAGVVQAEGPRIVCTKTNPFPQGETCASLCSKFGLGLQDLLTVNPWIKTCTIGFPAGIACSAIRKPDCLQWATATTTSCANIMAAYPKYLHTTHDFYNLNDNVDEQCDNLTIHNHYCVQSN